MSLTKQYFKYVSQNIFGLLGTSCYILADTYFISQAAGTSGVALLNLCLPIYNFIFAIGSMLGLGAATRYAILRAQGDERSERYFSNALLWALVFALPFMLAGIFCPEVLLRFMGGDAEIVALGVGYARIFLLFTPFFMCNYIVSAFVRNDGDPSLAMVATLCGSLFNVVFDYIFMFPMGLGLPGAALATAVSPVLSIAICSRHFFKKSSTVRLVRQLPSPKLLAQSCQLGVSGFVGEMSSGVTTTVFNLLTNVYQPTRGSILIDGMPTAGKKTYQVNRMGVARTFQNIRLFKELSVIDNIKVGLHESMKYNLASSLIRLPNYWKEEKRCTERAFELLDIFHMADLADAQAGSLPYGAQRRLEIMRALATSPKLLLLDEPAAGMNPSETAELTETIRRIRDEFNIAVLLIEHDMSLVMGICEGIAVLNFGRIIAKGTPDEIRNNPQVIEAYLGKKEG